MGNKQEFDVKDVVARLAHYRRRISLAAVDAMHLHEIWSAFNDVEERRRAIDRSPAGPAAALYEEAVLRNLILILVRLFDDPGKKDILRSDRITFPVVRELLTLRGVEDVFINHATLTPLSILFGNRGGDDECECDDEPERNAQTVRDRIVDFNIRLRRLETEEPNRIKMLRNFRHENIAHELRPDESRIKPTHGHIAGIVSEVLTLTKDIDLIMGGSSEISWRRGEAGKSATHLWDAVAEAFSVSN